MMYAKVFLVGGLICAAGQLLLLYTNLTSARILVAFVTAGVVLTALGRTRARIMDPLCGERTLTAGEFLFMFEKMGSRAVALT